MSSRYPKGVSRRAAQPQRAPVASRPANDNAVPRTPVNDNVRPRPAQTFGEGAANLSRAAYREWLKLPRPVRAVGTLLSYHPALRGLATALRYGDTALGFYKFFTDGAVEFDPNSKEENKPITWRDHLIKSGRAFYDFTKWNDFRSCDGVSEQVMVNVGWACSNNYGLTPKDTFDANLNQTREGSGGTIFAHMYQRGDDAVIGGEPFVRLRSAAQYRYRVGIEGAAHGYPPESPHKTSPAVNLSPRVVNNARGIDRLASVNAQYQPILSPAPAPWHLPVSALNSRQPFINQPPSIQRYASYYNYVGVNVPFPHPAPPVTVNPSQPQLPFYEVPLVRPTLEFIGSRVRQSSARGHKRLPPSRNVREVKVNHRGALRFLELTLGTYNEVRDILKTAYDNLPPDAKVRFGNTRWIKRKPDFREMSTAVFHNFYRVNWDATIRDYVWDNWVIDRFIGEASMTGRHLIDNYGLTMNVGSQIGRINRFTSDAQLEALKNARNKQKEGG